MRTLCAVVCKQIFLQNYLKVVLLPRIFYIFSLLVNNARSFLLITDVKTDEKPCNIGVNFACNMGKYELFTISGNSLNGGTGVATANCGQGIQWTAVNPTIWQVSIEDDFPGLS
jgi:hypothetical protein